MNIFTIIALSALVSDTLGINFQLDSSFTSSTHKAERSPIACVEIKGQELNAICRTQSLPQQLSFLPSVVAVSECGTAVGYTSFSVRGISGYHTNVTLNGINLGDSESQEVFWVNIPGLSSILSSVGMQRGLGTATCGPGAFGASLNMETTAPLKAGGSISGSYSSFITGTCSARGYSGVLKNGFFCDAALNFQHSRGYIRNAPATLGSAYANIGYKGSKDVVQAVFLQGWQRSAITWNGVPFDIYPHDRRFNVSEGDTDNFSQSHIQINHRHDFGIPLKSNTTFNYTHGYGWYDIDGNRDFLRNNLYVLRSDLSWTPVQALNVSAVAYFSHFIGKHWGIPASGSVSYSDTAYKKEADLSVRAEWQALPVLSVFGECQWRGVIYDLYTDRHSWNFCNPRLGTSWSPSSSHKVYFSAAMGNREPSRTDFDANPLVRNERLYDFELGYRYSSYIFSGSLNLYAMEYRNMLLETGDVDSQGYVIRDNVPSAHRRGIELELSVHPLKWLKIDANGCLSDNRHGGGPLRLSPSVIAWGAIKVLPWKGFMAQFDGKYVGKQYYDNSGATEREVPQYVVFNLSLSQEFRLPFTSVTVSAYLDNLLNRQYYAYANNCGVYPAAPINGGVKLLFSIFSGPSVHADV